MPPKKKQAASSTSTTNARPSRKKPDLDEGAYYGPRGIVRRVAHSDLCKSATTATCTVCGATICHKCGWECGADFCFNRICDKHKEYALASMCLHETFERKDVISPIPRDDVDTEISVDMPSHSTPKNTNADDEIIFDAAAKKLKRTTMRLLALHTFRCLDYDHPNRVDKKDWACPKCGSGVNLNMILRDGGNALCANPDCAGVFHWCAFKGDAGGYEVDCSPEHILDVAPALKKCDRPTTKKLIAHMNNPLPNADIEMPPLDATAPWEFWGAPTYPLSKEEREERTRLTRRILFGHTYNCVSYKHPNRVEKKDWKCPRCGSAAGPAVIKSDGGSAICSNADCKNAFHWCAFEGPDGGFTDRSGPYHILVHAPKLPEIEGAFRKLPEPKKAKLESADARRTFHDIFEYETVNTEKRLRPSYNHCTIVSDKVDKMKKGEFYENIEVALTLYGWDDVNQDLVEGCITEWKLDSSE